MLAVVSVVANHLLGWPDGGFVGVDVFFVISGFLITGLLLREHERSGKISMVSFYWRRARRLLPAGLLVLLVTVALSAFLVPQTQARGISGDALFSALFMANWRFAINGTDYFQVGQGVSPLQHYWSLSVEEQFYVVWPILIILILGMAVRYSWSNRGRLVFLLVVVATAVVISVVWAAVETRTLPAVAYFSTFSRAWELGVGAALAIVLRLVQWRLPQRFAVGAAYIGMAGIVISFFVVESSNGFPMPGALLPVLSTALVLAAGAEQTAGYSIATWPLTNPVSRYIGDISYSLYLWHFPVIILGVVVLPAGSRRYIAFSLVVMILLSILSFHFVETPARRMRFTVWKPRARMVTLGVAGAAVIILVAGIAVVGNKLFADVPNPAISSVASEGCQGAAAMVNGCTENDLTGVVTPALDNLVPEPGEQYECWKEADKPWPDCSDSFVGGDGLRVAVLGDSHAAMYLPALRAIAEDNHWRVDVYTGYACQWIIDHEGACADHLDDLHQKLSEGELDYDVIITGAARWSLEGRSGQSGDYAATWEAVMERGTQVIAIEDAPMVSEDLMQCVQRSSFAFSPEECHVTPERGADAEDSVALATHNSNAELLRTWDLFCNDEVCPAVIGGVIVYRDAVAHVTAEYVSTMTPYIQERLEELIDDEHIK